MHGCVVDQKLPYLYSHIYMCSNACMFAAKVACTVLDTDNLHFSEEFLDFPVRTDADIHADVLGFSARFRCGFPHVCTRNTLPSQAASNDLKRRLRV